MSNNPFGTTPFRRGEDLTARKLETLRDADQSNTLSRNLDTFVKRLAGGTVLKSKTKPQAAGSTLAYIYTGEVGTNYGSLYDKPGGTETAFAEGDGVTFAIGTPWNTTKTAPDKFYGYMNKFEDEYIFPLEKFYVKCTENYPSGAGAGIEDFSCYMGKSDSSLLLGDETDFPTGIKCLLDGFDNEDAGTNSLNYFNGKVFQATFDSAANIIYLEHPTF